MINIGNQLQSALNDIQTHFNGADISVDLYHDPEDYMIFEIRIHENENMTSKDFIQKLQTVHKIIHRSLSSVIVFNMKFKD